MAQSNLHASEMLQQKLDATYGKILGVQQALEEDDAVCEAVYQLQDEFNVISCEMKTTPRFIYPDPLEILPPEVWQGIILETAHNDGSDNDPMISMRMDTIFPLTLVSLAWLRKITGNPLLWNRIRVDRFQSDSTAKVATRLELSKECPLLIYTNYTHEEWVKILPLVLPHIGRIVELTIEEPFSTAILNSMPSLPNLQALGCPPMKDARYDNELVEIGTIDFSRMPQLQRVPTSLYFDSLDSPWLKFAEDITSVYKTISEEHINCMKDAPQLRRMQITEEGYLETTASNTLTVSLPNLRSFVYFGPNARRALSLIGLSLTHLEIGCAYMDFLWDIIGLTKQIPLCSLALVYYLGDGVGPLESTKRAHITRRPELMAPGIKRLRISHPNSTTDPGYDDWVQSMHQIIVHALVGVESLEFYDVLLTDQVQHYIESLPRLQILLLVQCIADGTASFPLRTPGTLRRVHCTNVGLLFPIELWKESSFGRCLTVSLTLRRRESEDQTMDILPLTSRGPFGQNWPNIDVSLEKSVPSQTLYDIQSVIIWGDKEPLSLYIGNLFELAALKPGDFPGLEDVWVSQGNLEWDLLILMLERRNLQSKSEISRISTIILRSWIPKHLMRVLLALLAGCYPARRSLASYSLDAVGKRMFDPKLSGCYNCCFLLRECDSAPQPPHNQADQFPTFHKDLQSLPLDYSLPHEVSMAEPPLTKRDATWLAGRKGRRREFKEGYLRSLSILSRIESCSEQNSWLTLNASEYFDDNT